MTKVILFDIYQTLVDVDINEENKKRNEAKAWENLTKSLMQYGINITPAKFIELNSKQREKFYVEKDKKIYHHNFCKIMAEVLKDDLSVELSQEEIYLLIYEYRKIARGHARLYPGISETLERLTKKYILATASYTQGSFTKPELEELNIEKFFSYFIYTSDIGLHKASPQFYKQCLEIVKSSAENCVMVGDNYDVDVLVPQKLGIKTIWVKNPLTASEYAHLINQEPKDTINLEEFVKLPEAIERAFE